MGAAVIKVGAKVSSLSKEDKLKAIQAACKRANGSNVQVGWQGDEKYPTGEYVWQVAIWNEYGTRNPDGSVRSPARPFMRPAMDKNRGRIADLQMEALQRVAFGGWTIGRGLQKIGYTTKILIQKEIVTNTYQARTETQLAERTLRDRRARENLSEKPLIDTGRMLRNLKLTVNLSASAKIEEEAAAKAEQAKAKTKADIKAARAAFRKAANAKKSADNKKSRAAKRERKKAVKNAVKAAKKSTKSAIKSATKKLKATTKIVSKAIRGRAKPKSARPRKPKA